MLNAELIPVNSPFAIVHDPSFVSWIVKLFEDNSMRIIDTSRYSFYKEKIVVWDEDTDTRILLFLDRLEVKVPEIFNSIIYIQEHEGGLDILFSNPISADLLEILEGGVNCDGDNWCAQYAFI